LNSLFAPPTPIHEDLDGWSAVVPGAAFNPILLLIGVVHLIMGWTFVIGALAGAIVSLANGQLALALFAVPFGLVGSVFALWPIRVLLAVLHRTTLEVSGQSLRIERRVAGVPYLSDELRLAECGDVLFSEGFTGTLRIGGHRIPAARGPGFERAIELLEQGARAAVASPDVIPPEPEALRGLRGSAAQGVGDA
jgi:hypothetical protein